MRRVRVRQAQQCGGGKTNTRLSRTPTPEGGGLGLELGFNIFIISPGNCSIFPVLVKYIIHSTEDLDADARMLR
ncbi:hypothetical protein E2C01_032442 [Portunus trituberculatus]|uniref:Uncharacterized protein n=1 Tax=Portunus trituberculatus TaxID=210409 RepID=A0A5B7F2T9_PORTR|nr:hypothetical protein [Portunus trituberculatus]